MSVDWIDVSGLENRGWLVFCNYSRLSCFVFAFCMIVQLPGMSLNAGKYFLTFHSAGIASGESHVDVYIYHDE